MLLLVAQSWPARRPPTGSCFPYLQFRIFRKSMPRPGSPAPSSAASEGASTDDDASTEPQRYATHAPEEVVLSEDEG